MSYELVTAKFISISSFLKLFFLELHECLPDRQTDRHTTKCSAQWHIRRHQSPERLLCRCISCCKQSSRSWFVIAINKSTFIGAKCSWQLSLCYWNVFLVVIVLKSGKFAGYYQLTCTTVLSTSQCWLLPPHLTLREHPTRHILGHFGRAGFTLSRALFRKKCGGPSPGAADPILPEKKLATFFAHHSRSLGGCPLFLACNNLRVLLWGPFFVWRPLFGRTCWTCLNPTLYFGDI